MPGNTVDVDYVSVCRLCLANDCSLRSIFDHTSINIPEIIKAVAELEISESDPYSKLICKRCIGLVESIAEFKTKCIESLRTASPQKQTYIDESHTEEESCTATQRVEFIECQSVEEAPNTAEYDEDGIAQNTSSSEHEEPTENESVPNDTLEPVETTPQQSSIPECLSTCELCGESFPGMKKMLHYHMKSDHADDGGLPRIRQCFYCPKAYSSYQLLKYHLNFHPRKVWQCPQCDKMIERKGIFIDHLRSHANERHYECEECGVRFTAIKYLSNHRRMHARKKGDNTSQNNHPHRGQAQQERNIPSASASNHHIQYQRTEPNTYECEVCGRKLKNKSSYTNHCKTHRNNGSVLGKTGRKPFKEDEKKRVFLCNICGNDCGSSSNLGVHLRRHNGQSVCECTVCGKGFPRRSDLIMHMRKHTGEKPFECPTCGRRFSRRDKLRIHIRTHTGEKPYPCPCGRAYAQKNDLKTHQIRNCCGQNFDVSKLLASCPTTICIKSPSRTDPSSAVLPQSQHGLRESFERTSKSYNVSSASTSILGATTDGMVGAEFTTNWSHCMNHATVAREDYGNGSFPSDRKLAS